MNMTEKSERWPMTSVAMPSAQQRLVATGEERAPGRVIGRRPVEPRGDLGHQILDEADVEGGLAVGEAQVDEARDERGSDLRRDAVDELVERRAVRTLLLEPLVSEDLVADREVLLLGEVEERAPLELLGVDPVGDAGERYAGGAQLADEAPRVERGFGQRGRLDDDREVVELAEFAIILAVPLDVGLAGGPEAERRGLERQRPHRVEDGHDGEAARPDHPDGRGRARHAYQPPQGTTHPPGQRHLLVA